MRFLPVHWQQCYYINTLINRVGLSACVGYGRIRWSTINRATQLPLQPSCSYHSRKMASEQSSSATAGMVSLDTGDVGPSPKIILSTTQTPRTTFSSVHMDALMHVVQDIVNLSNEDGREEDSVEALYEQIQGTTVSKMDKTTVVKLSPRTAHEKLWSLVPTSRPRARSAVSSAKKDEFTAEPFGSDVGVPISDIAVVYGGESVPKGYEKVR